MATKQINLRLEDAQILDIKSVAEVFRMSFTDVVKAALDSYLKDMKKDPMYRLTMNVEEVSDKENEELSKLIDELSSDDLEIVKTEVMRV